jgi:hypothetical protein
VPRDHRVIRRHVSFPFHFASLTRVVIDGSALLRQLAMLLVLAHVICMYTVALNASNLDSLGPSPLIQPSSNCPSTTPSLSPDAAFDGTMAYAQHKRCQVEMTERWAKCAPSGVRFYSMHPGLFPAVSV